jgi:mono/diheme cytochrome c family protein
VRNVAVKVVAVAAVVGLAFGLAARSHAGQRTAERAAVSPGTYTLKTALSAKQEVPAPKGAARAVGSFTATFTVVKATSTKLAWRLTFSRLSGPATAAHIHLGAPGKAGKVVVTLCGPCASGAHGTYTKPIPAAVQTALISGKAYVNVHTKLNPAGEIRGQFKAATTGGTDENPYANIKVIATPALVARGKALVENYSCQACHTLNGTQSTGPTWKGIAGKRVRLTNGKTVTRTDGYLLLAILQPDAETVRGYSGGVMTTAIGDVGLVQAKAITAYLKTVK